MSIPSRWTAATDAGRVTQFRHGAAVSAGQAAEAPDATAVGVPQLRTQRLVLRAWQAADRPAFAAMNADPRVMEFFPALMSEEESNAAADRIEQHFAEHGFGLWAVQALPGEPVDGFIGFVGLAVPRFTAPFTPCVEVGWRLRADAWGRGYATEAAQAGLRFGFERAGLTEIVSFTAPANVRSRAVMQRLGLRHDPQQDFEHSHVPEGSPLRPHVLYRLTREEWRTRPQRP